MVDPYAMGAGDAMFQIVPIFIGTIFVIVIGSILISVFKDVGEWQKNEHSPRLSVPAVVTSKRIDVTKRSNMHHHNDTHHHHSSRTHTKYFVTFEFESGDRPRVHHSLHGTASTTDSHIYMGDPHHPAVFLYRLL